MITAVRTMIPTVPTVPTTIAVVRTMMAAVRTMIPAVPTMMAAVPTKIPAVPTMIRAAPTMIRAAPTSSARSRASSPGGDRSRHRGRRWFERHRASVRGVCRTSGGGEERRWPSPWKPGVSGRDPRQSLDPPPIPWARRLDVGRAGSPRSRWSRGIRHRLPSVVGYDPTLGCPFHRPWRQAATLPEAA